MDNYTPVGYILRNSISLDLLLIFIKIVVSWIFLVQKYFTEMVKYFCLICVEDLSPCPQAERGCQVWWSQRQRQLALDGTALPSSDERIRCFEPGGLISSLATF